MLFKESSRHGLYSARSHRTRPRVLPGQSPLTRRYPSPLSLGHLLIHYRLLPNYIQKTELTSLKSDMMRRAQGKGRSRASISSTTINHNVMRTHTVSLRRTNCQHYVCEYPLHGIPELPHPRSPEWGPPSMDPPAAHGSGA
jgi:hypothetical protein